MDSDYVIAKDACFGENIDPLFTNCCLGIKFIYNGSDFIPVLINISAYNETAVEALLKSSPTSHDNSGLIQIILKNVLESKSQIADPILSIFSNISRSENLVENIMQTMIEIDETILDRLVAVYTKLDYNSHKQTLDYLAAVFSNLSQTTLFRNLLVTSQTRLLQRLLPFMNFTSSLIRRGGIAGLLKNICFDTSLHDWLFSADVDVLPFILLPLAGPEEFDDQDNDKFPMELQFLGPDKQREPDADIRVILLESLAQLCATRKGRIYLRDKGTYEILRELHKYEISSIGDPRALRACENVVDILIRTEDEIVHDNLKHLEIPDDVMPKIEKLVE